MAFVNFQLPEIAIAPVVGQHKRGDTSLIGLERQHQDVVHQSDMFTIAFGNTRGTGTPETSGISKFSA